ncbi:MAG: S8 family serine peptidase [Cyclobacteriaceae bacterium]|nr:S8 family serine peptidase [Cyclobacteriaceae bacterium]
MRSFSVFIVVVFTLSIALGQKTGKQIYKFPSHFTSSDCEAGVALVKIKSKYREIFAGDASANRIAQAGILNITPIIPEKLASKAQARQAPRALSISGVDLSLYYQVNFNLQDDIEQVINKLYATEYFDIVEPSFKYYQSYLPNDPSTSSQYYLSKIKAFDAWDISKSNADVVIAIIDSGGDLDHPDLSSKLFVNENEIPNNGIDDDGNGFIDDVTGWDFSGAERALIGTPGFVGDNNPSVIKGGTHSHGTNVAGCAAAATDNGVGIAGVGFNARLLFTKHYADDQSTEDRFYSSSLYLGMLYAANVLTENSIEKKIINCSFGGSGRSQIIQDFINFITLDLGCLVVAAAGNNSSDELHYPAAYDNVLSVASTDSNDRKSGFSNFGNWVDISAPGSSIFTTGFDDIYSSVNGTSFSCPIVSGAAALVWSAQPDLTATQLAERLRVTADESFYGSNLASLKNKLGKGRLDILSALTVNFPSLRASKIRVQNEIGSSAIRPGQKGILYFDVFNHLSSTSSEIEISVTSSSSLVTFTKSKIYPGVINQNATVSLKQNPFTFIASSAIPVNRVIEFTVNYSDGNYRDYQVISVNLNPSYIDIEENQISTTISSIGRIGYDGDGQARGLGFQFNGTDLLYEMGLIVGNSSSSILNNVRGASSGPYDQDFVEINKIDQVIPGERTASEIFGLISNSSNPANQDLLITYRSMVMREPPNDKFIIVEYKIKNPTSSTKNDYYFGLFADWDIAQGDGADWNAANKLGYIFPKTDTSLPLAGIQVLTGNALHYAIDNNQNTDGTPFGLYDGYTDQEKFTTISTNRDAAGVVPEGGDVSHVVSTGPFNLAANQEITIAFAIHAADNLESLLESAGAANTLYNLTFNAPQPIVEINDICYGGVAIINATGSTSFNWYKDFTGGVPFFSGSQYVTEELFRDTTFYVSNADNPYESVRTPALISLKANPLINLSGPSTFCEGSSVILGALDSDEYQWSNGATTKEIEISEPGDYSVTVRDLSLNCESSSQIITLNVIPSPVAAFTTGNAINTNIPINFTNQSIAAISWLWQFGDGTSSTLQNPTHTYSQNGDYTVSLTVTASNGCQNSVSKPLDVITSIESEFSKTFSVHPNPIINQDKIAIQAKGLTFDQSRVEILTLQGHKIHSSAVSIPNGSLLYQIDVSQLPAGIYLLLVQNNQGEKILRKIIKTN